MGLPLMTEVRGSSLTASASYTERVIRKAQALMDALEDERLNHGDLVTPKRQRAMNELRLELGKIGRT
jgi:hypothetical protein